MKIIHTNAQGILPIKIVPRLHIIQYFKQENIYNDILKQNMNLHLKAALFENKVSLDMF